MKTFIIYEARNIVTNRVYIGQTSRKLSQRMAEHLRRSFFRKSDFYLDLKNSPENFKWVVVAEVKSQADANDAEAAYLKKSTNIYNKYKWANVPENLGELVTKALMGHRHSEDTRLKQSLAKLGKRSNRVYMPHSSEHERKRRETVIKNSKYRIVDMDTGEIFGIAAQVCEKYGYCDAKLSRHLLGKSPEIEGKRFRKEIICRPA